MANHLRRQIREAVATAVTGLTTTGSRVFQSPIYVLQRSNLPGLRVYSADETIVGETIHAPVLQNRVYRVRVEAVAQATADLDDVLDGICKEVEIAVAGMSLTGLAKTIALTEISEPQFDERGEVPTGKLPMLFEVNYYAAANAPDVSL